MSHRRFAPVLALALAFAPLTARAFVSREGTLTPASGSPLAPTPVTLAGEGFQPGSRVSLLQAAPERLGSTLLPLGPAEHAAVAVEAGHAFVVQEDHLYVYDVRDPAAPGLVGELSLGITARWGAEALFASGRYLYMGYEDLDAPGGTLLVMDVTTPSAPVLKGTCSLPDVRDLYVSGGYAYAASDRGLEIVDVSDPAAPATRGFYASAQELQATAVSVSGTTVYLGSIRRPGYGGGSGALDLLDASNPSQPALLGSTTVQVFGLGEAEGYAYVASGDAGLQVFDVRHPRYPMLVGSVELSGEALDVALGEGVAYVLDVQSGFRIVDVSEPSQPSFVTDVESTGPVHELCAADARVYTLSTELEIVDVHGPQTPLSVGRFAVADGSPLTAVEVSGDRTFATSSMGGFYVLDTADPSQPALLGSLPPSGRWGTDVVSYGGLVYELTFGGLYLIDASTPASPLVVSSFLAPPDSDLGGYLYVAGDYAYEGARGLERIDFHDRSNPVIEGYSPGPRWGVHGLGGAGDYVYVSTGIGALEVLSASELTLPRFPGSYYRPDPPVEEGRDAYYAGGGLAVSGNRAYQGASLDLYRDMTVEERRGFLDVFDLSDPTNPVPLGSCQLGGLPTVVREQDGQVFSVDSDRKDLVFAVDASDPTAPYVAGLYRVSEALDVAASGDYLVVAAYTEGLYFLRRHPPATGVEVVGPTLLRATLPAGLEVGSYDLLVSPRAGAPSLYRGAYRVLADGIAIDGQLTVPDVMASGEAAQLSVTARDVYGHEPQYAWTVSCPSIGEGVFSDASGSPTWTAPANLTGYAEDCTLRVTVSDAEGGRPALRIAVVRVLPAHVIVMTAGPASAPAELESSGVALLEASAFDPEHDQLSYAWSAACGGLADAGTFLDPSAAATSWTSPRNATGETVTCTLTVTVSDGAGLTLSRGADVTVASIPDSLVLSPLSVERPTIAGGEKTSVSVSATDPLHQAELTYAWSFSCSNGAEVVSSGSDGFSAQAPSTIWTAPGNSSELNLTCKLTVAVTDGHGLTEERTADVTVEPNAPTFGPPLGDAFCFVGALETERQGISPGLRFGVALAAALLAALLAFRRRRG